MGTPPQCGETASFSVGKESFVEGSVLPEKAFELAPQGEDVGFPGGPVVKTPCSQCRGPRFNPWSGN